GLYHPKEGSCGGGGSSGAVRYGRVGVSAKSFASLIEAGEKGPYSAMISRDVPRAFGAVAPHKRDQHGPVNGTSLYPSADPTAA
ncbi:unnamed protein product, partial [Discosporangium mesarthrocarpum]